MMLLFGVVESGEPSLHLSITLRVHNSCEPTLPAPSCFGIVDEHSSVLSELRTLLKTQVHAVFNVRLRLFLVLDAMALGVTATTPTLLVFSKKVLLRG
jgi:hypothetical protein